MNRWRWTGIALLALALGTAWAPHPQGGDTTEDPSAIVVTQLHVFVTRSGDWLQVGEYYLVSNTGDQTYIGTEDPATSQRVTLRFTLPEGAVELAFDGPGLGERFVEQEGGFADTEPVPPGMATSEVLFSYSLPYQEGVTIERPFDLPVDSVVIVVPGEQMGLEGPDLVPGGVMDTQSGPAFSYTAGPFEAGEALAFAPTAQQPMTAPPAMPSSSTAVSPSAGGNRGVELAVGLAALVAAAVGVFFLWRAPAPGPMPPQVRPLVEAIVALDAEYEAGKMGEKAYRKKRRELKRQVRVLVERGSGGATGS